MSQQPRDDLRVAANFVSFYYPRLIRTPSELAPLYMNKAQYSFIIGRSSHQVLGAREIARELEANFTKNNSRVTKVKVVKLEIQTDQTSEQGCFTFVVDGKFLRADGSAQFFKHLFQLKQHPESSNDFSIYSDHWRLIEEVAASVPVVQPPQPPPRSENWAELTPQLYAKEDPAELPPEMEMPEATTTSGPSEKPSAEPNNSRTEDSQHRDATGAANEHSAAATEETPANDPAATATRDTIATPPADQPKKSFADLIRGKSAPSKPSAPAVVVAEATPSTKTEGEKRGGEKPVAKSGGGARDKKDSGSATTDSTTNANKKPPVDDAASKAAAPSTTEEEPAKTKAPATAVAAPASNNDDDAAAAADEKPKQPSATAPAANAWKEGGGLVAKLATTGDQQPAPASSRPAKVVVAESPVKAKPPASADKTDKKTSSPENAEGSNNNNNGEASATARPRKSGGGEKGRSGDKNGAGGASNNLANLVSHYHVFIRGLPPGTTESDVREAIEKFVPLQKGMKIDSKIDSNSGTDKVRTFAFVSLDVKPEEVQEKVKALCDRKIRIRGQNVVCDEVREKTIFMPKK